MIEYGNPSLVAILLRRAITFSREKNNFIEQCVVSSVNSPVHEFHKNSIERTKKFHNYRWWSSKTKCWKVHPYSRKAILKGEILNVLNYFQHSVSYSGACQ